MTALQKLARHGNSTAVSIPRAMLQHIDWLPGQHVIVEVLEDKSIRVRRPTEHDFMGTPTPRLMFDEQNAVTK